MDHVFRPFALVKRAAEADVMSAEWTGPRVKAGSRGIGCDTRGHYVSIERGQQLVRIMQAEIDLALTVERLREVERASRGTD